MQTKDLTDGQLEEALEVLGLPTGDHCKEQLRGMAEALVVLDEREAVHNGLWKEGGHVDTATHIRSKGSRVVRGTAEHDHELACGVRDDAIDLINYGCFWIRNVDEDRLGEDVDPD